LTSLPFPANGRLWLADLINRGCNLPLKVAPLAAGVVLGLMNSYQALFSLVGSVAIAAGWTVSQDRSVP
jgi:hypothetical protein